VGTEHICWLLQKIDLPDYKFTKHPVLSFAIIDVLNPLPEALFFTILPPELHADFLVLYKSQVFSCGNAIFYQD